MFPVYEMDGWMKLFGAKDVIEDIEKELQRPWMRICIFFMIPLVTIKEDIKQLLHPKVKRKKIENERQK